MATPAELLDNMVPVSAFSRGKAAQAFSSASNSTPVIVLKNNAPYRVITTPDEYAYLSEVEADMVDGESGCRIRPCGRGVRRAGHRA